MAAELVRLVVEEAVVEATVRVAAGVVVVAALSSTMQVGVSSPTSQTKPVQQ